MSLIQSRIMTEKDYTSKRGSNDLLTVLSVADDLDAFGFAGIYRYSEIYLMTGYKPQSIGSSHP